MFMSRTWNKISRPHSAWRKNSLLSALCTMPLRTHYSLRVVGSTSRRPAFQHSLRGVGPTGRRPIVPARNASQREFPILRNSGIRKPELGSGRERSELSSLLLATGDYLHTQPSLAFQQTTHIRHLASVLQGVAHDTDQAHPNRGQGLVPWLV